MDRNSPTAVDLDMTEFESENRSLVSGHFGFLTIYVSQLPNPEVVLVTMQIRQGLSPE